MTTAQPDVASPSTSPAVARSIQRDRLKTAQEVAASIAHELRNPVFSIASAAQLLRYRVTDDPVIEKNIGRILREADRLNAFVNALFEYALPEPVRLAPGDPDDVWATVIGRLRGEFEAKAILVNLLPAEPRASCNVDVEQLALAFTNVLLNAIEAAPEGSDIEIRSLMRDDGAWGSIVRNASAPVDPDVVARALEPLVSGKPGHAGIGLAVAHRVLMDHGGSVALEVDDSSAALTFSLPSAHG